MTVDEFTRIVDEFDKKCQETYKVAMSEYASHEDAFANFELIALLLSRMSPRLRDIRPEDVALTYMMKHLCSIANGVSVRESLDGRYCDAINYLKLHYGMAKESGHA